MQGSLYKICPILRIPIEVALFVFVAETEKMFYCIFRPSSKRTARGGRTRISRLQAAVDVAYSHAVHVRAWREPVRQGRLGHLPRTGRDRRSSLGRAGEQLQIVIHTTTAVPPRPSSVATGRAFHGDVQGVPVVHS